MERTLGLRPRWAICLLGPIFAAGCAVTVDATMASADPAPDTIPMALAIGDLCDGVDGQCPVGSCCRDDHTWINRRCIADGAEFGQCRSATPECDEGLVCRGTGVTSVCGR